MSIPAHLKGPWTAYLMDEDGFAHSSAEAARASGYPEFQVLIVRAGARPKPVGTDKLRFDFLPVRDVIWIAEDEIGLDDNRYTFGAAAQFDRAAAMAAGLNTAGEIA